MTTDHATLVSDPPPAGDDQARSADGPARSRDIRGDDRLAAFVYALTSFFLTIQLWAQPNTVMLRENRQDETAFEWELANAVHTIRHLADPFLSDLLNAPLGVNLMANTSVWGLSLPLAPITALLGQDVAFRVLLTGVFFGTAMAWYHVLSRHVVRSRLAAFAGGAFCAFAPGMMGQANGHPNVVGQFVLPFIVMVLLRMRTPGNVVRNGLCLAGLVVYQIFINEEILLLAALALGVFILVYWVQRPAVIGRCLRSGLLTVAVTVAVAGVVAAYPLYRQFFGRQSYHGLPDWVLDYNTNLASYFAYADQSVAGVRGGASRLAQGVSEQNTFYGWGLIALLVIITAWMWRRPAVRALAVTGGLFALLSLGRHIVVGQTATGIPGPWLLLSKLPLLDTVVPTRLSLVVIPVVGVLLAFFVERLVIDGADAAAPARFWTPMRVLGFGALAVAIVPIAPTPLPVQPRPAAPMFFATGAWRSYMPAGGTVALLPFGWNSDWNMMQWQTDEGLPFKIVNGYFLGPDPSDNDKGQYGGAYTQVRQTLWESQNSPITVGPEQRAECLGELVSWHTNLMVLPDNVANAAVIRDGTSQILGPGTHVQDVWVWRVPGVS